jgi:hypothetical protein
MTLGIALVTIFVLYLIDKHNRWRQALKLVIALAVAAVLLYGGTYAYTKYATWRVTRCVAKSTTAGNATAAAEIEAACEHDPSKPLALDMSKTVPFDPNAPFSGLPKAAPDYQKMACEAGAIDPACKPSSVKCGLDASGHIIPDGKGGCIPPPPDGYIIDAPQAK